MKKNLMPFIMIISALFVMRAYSDVHTAETPSYADVSKAVADAEPGDTVLVKAGSAVWPSAIEITKPISIIGAGRDKTKLIAGWSTTKNHFLVLHGFTSDNPVRIGGFYFDLVDFKAACSAIRLYDVSISQLRIEHNEFHHGYEQINVGGCKGVIDRNYFYNPLKGISFTAGSRPQADASWESLVAGTGDALFVENNRFIIDKNYVGNAFQENIGTYNGGKLVIRYNHFDSTFNPLSNTVDPVMTHGSAGGGIANGYWQIGTGARRGQSVVEIYNNLMEGKRIDFPVIVRGSTNLIYDNTVNRSAGYKSRIYLREEEYDVNSNWSPPRVVWPAEDQVHNTFLWNNTDNGAQMNSDPATHIISSPQIVRDRDYFLHEPQSTGGSEYFTGKNGASDSYPTNGILYPTLGAMVFTPEGPNAHYLYTPYPYPHALSVQDETGRLLNLHKTLSPGKINFDWDAISGTTGYGISRDWGAIVPIASAATAYTDNNPGQVYMVYAYGADGKVLAAEGVNSDEQAPSKPGNLHDTAVTSSSVTLAWDASTDNFGVRGYRVYRGDSPVSVANVSGVTTATIRNLEPLTGYSFTVAAYDAAGNESAKSNPVSVITKAGFIISGKVTLGGTGLSDVVMSGLLDVVKTNANGEYTANVDQGWSGIIAPGLSGYTFSPVNRIYNNTVAEQVDQDYTATKSAGGSNSGGDAGGGGGGGCFVAAAQSGGVSGRCLEWLDMSLVFALLLLVFSLNKTWSGKMKKIIMGIGAAVSALSIVCGAAQAMTYYVDQNFPEAGDSNAGTESRPWMTIQHAADIMQPGDSVTVKPGVYNERVQPRYSGSAGRPIIYKASGSGVIARGFYLVDRSHLNIIGFEITHNGSDAAYPAIQLNASHYSRILDNNIHHTSQAGIDLHFNTSCNRNLVRGNRISYAGINDRIAMGAGGIIIRGNENIVEYNDISHVGDFTNVFGANNIVRNNYFHDCYYSETPDWNALHPEGHHLDGVQSYTDSAALLRCLVEYNYWRDTSTMSNAHFIMMQGPANRHLLIRNNVVVRGGGYAAIVVDVDDVKFVHNTFVDTSAYYPPSLRVWEAVSFQAGASGGRIMNNIFYAAARAGGRPYDFADTTDSFADYNLAFDSGVASETNGMFNIDPLFADYAHDDHRLSASSPAIDSAGPITRTIAAGTGRMVYVQDCRYFCDGFGVSEPDWIKVGNNNPVRIAAVNDTANTITVADPITWNGNDPVYLAFFDTVLNERGAYPYRTGGNNDYSVTLTHPIENSSVSGIVIISAAVSNPDLVRQVVFYADGIPIALINQAPYAFEWDSRDLAAGIGHTIEARAYTLYAGPILWKTDDVTVHKLGLFLSLPSGGETWVRDTGHDITWSASGVTEPVRIELFKGGVLDSVIAENQAVADGFYAWLIPAGQETGNDYTVRLTAGTHESTSGNFSIVAPGPPAVTTDPATSVTQTSTVLRGRVHPMGHQTTYHFEYGLTAAYGTETAEATLATGADQTTVQTAIAGLEASMVYHFRIVATNSEGTAEGTDLTFTTNSSGGDGGGSGDAGGGGGGGGCFVAALGGVNPGFVIAGLIAVWAGRAKSRSKEK